MARDTDPKTLFIIFSNLGLGGIQRKIVDIANYYAYSNPSLQIHILVRKKGRFSIENHINNHNVHIHSYENSHIKKNSIEFIGYILKLVIYYNPQTILTFLSPFSIPTVAIKMIIFWRKIKVIISEDHVTSGMLSILQHPFVNKVGIILLYKHADKIVSPTLAAKDDLVKNFFIPANKIVVIKNWTSIQGNLMKRKKWDIIYAGRFVKQKNVLSLINIIAQLKATTTIPLRTCLIGDGPEKKAYQEFIKKYELNNIVSINKPTYNIDRYFRFSYLCICNSERYGEGFPIAILDAMASGSIVISSNFAGVEDVIKQGINGFIVHNENELYKRILSLLRQKNKQLKIVYAAQKYVHQYHSTKNIERYAQLL